MSNKEMDHNMIYGQDYNFGSLVSPCNLNVIFYF